MQGYSPFGKLLTEVQTADLVALKEAAEGWYIEYKREVPVAQSIAKSISAFANTYGGWVFYGVGEKSKEDAVAGSFPGIHQTEVDAALQRMRQAVATLLTPAPHFDVKVFWGPCDEITLQDGHAIICAHVPWSPNTPHVHKSGHIYRRVADGSEPKPESDRFTLDQLWKRADKLRAEYSEWVNKQPELSKGEAETPYIRLLIKADLWRDRDVWADVSLSEMREIVNAKTATRWGVPFDNVYTSASGFIARQLMGNDPHNISLTWRFRRDLTSEVIIPLAWYRMSDILPDELSGYENTERYYALLSSGNHQRTRIIDLNSLFNILVGVVNIQDNLSTKAGWVDPLHCKITINNVWRASPFIDVEHAMSTFEDNGVPMCLDDKMIVWPGSDPETFFSLGTFDDVEIADARVLLKAIQLFLPVAEAFGVPGWIQTDDGSANCFYHELEAAGARAAEVQRRRNLGNKRN